MARNVQGGMIGNDFMSRYAQAASQPADIGQSIVNSMFGSVFGGRQRSTRQEAVEEAAAFDGRLAKEAAKGDSSLVGYLNNYSAKVQKIVDLMQSDERNFVEAERLYKDLQETASDNQDALAGAVSYADYGGMVARDISASALALKSGQYANQAVNMSGQQVTLGQLFGGQGYVANRMNQFVKFGYDPGVADAYFGEDAGKSAAVGVFLRPGISMGGSDGNPQRVFNIGLLNEAAAFVAGGKDNPETGEVSNYTRMKNLFGEGNVQAVCSDVLQKFGDIGGMTDVLRGVVKYAESRPSTDPDSGLTAVRNFMSCVKDSTQAMFSNPSTGAVPEKLPPSERRWALLTSLAAMGAATERGEVLDFGNDRVRAAAMSAAEAVNLARHSGYDLFSTARTAGRDPMKEYQSWIGAFMDNSELTPNTFVSRELNDREVLRSRVFTAPVVGETIRGQSGAAGYYDGPSSRASGKVLTSEAAGVLGNEIENTVMRLTAGRRHSGQNLDLAVLGMLGDTGTGGGREQFTAAMSDVFRKSIAGSGGQVLATKVLIPALESRLRATTVQPFEMYRIMEDIATKEGKSPYLSDMTEAEAKKAVRSAKNWYLTNVSGPDMFADHRKALVNHYMDARFNIPLSEKEAQRRADMDIQRGVELMRGTNSPQTFDQFIQHITDTGIEYSVRVIDKGTGQPFDWKNRDVSTGFPILTGDDKEAYEIETLKLPGNMSQDIPKMSWRTVSGINALRAGAAPDWILRNQANKETYFAQQRFLSGSKVLGSED